MQKLIWHVFPVLTCPEDKRVEIGLTYIYGIGRKSAKDILEKAGINPDIRVKDLTDDQEAAAP